MTDEEKLYRQMHRAKIKVAVSASLLIAAVFLAIFMGTFEVSAGLEDVRYADYLGFNMPVPADGDQPFQVIGFSSRYVTLESNDNKQESGTYDLASVVRFDLTTGDHLINASAPEPSMNVGHVENVNEWYDGNANDPLVLVQFADVEPAVTTGKIHIDDTQSFQFHNETGSYRTYIWNASYTAPVGNWTEITSVIGSGSRVSGIIRLPYDESDDVVDYLVVSSNRTWEREFLMLNDMASKGIVYTMHAMHANGSLAWRINSSTSGSLIEMSRTMLWSGVTGFAINGTHFVIALPDGHVAVGNVSDGTESWNKSDIGEIVGFPCDHSGDGLPDVVCIDRSGNVLCLDGKNGSTVPGFVGFSIAGITRQSLRVASRFGTPYDLFLTWNQPTQELALYRHDASGVSLQRKINTAGFFLQDTRDLWKKYSNYRGEPCLALQMGPQSTGEGIRRFFSVADGTLLAEVGKVENDAITGDFFDRWFGLESVAISLYNGYRVDALEQGIVAMFELDSLNEVIFYSAMVVGLVAGLALIKARRTHSRLSRQEEAMQPELAAREHSITTTANTTRPLRSISMAMLLVVVASTVVFIVYIVVVGTGETLYESANYFAVRNGYITISLTLVSLPLIAVLYNHVSPRSAMLYIKIQRFFYQKLLRGKKEYRVVVLDMADYAKKFSISSIISRSLFPLLVSLTLGLTVFGAFASDTTGMGGTTGSINLVWLSEFELYAGLTFIGSYVLMMLISPGGWLLDDSGVVYFEQPVDTHQPGDISKISDWLTGWLKGFFGFTAILNYYQLFAGSDFTSMVNNDDPLMAILLIVFVFIIMIILSPILYGLIAMFSSNASMIDDLEYNRKILYDKLRKAGIDVAPKRLKDFFEKV